MMTIERFIELSHKNIPVYGRINGEKTRLIYRQPCGIGTVSVHDEKGAVYYLRFGLNFINVFTADDVWDRKDISLKISFLDKCRCIRAGLKRTLKGEE